jgi:hypothetical protein
VPERLTFDLEPQRMNIVTSMRDVERLALSMPGATLELRDDDRPAFVVDKKLFCFHRIPRVDALDPVTGERLDDVLVFRVANEGMKSMWLSARSDVVFTTNHFNGYPWVLLRIPSLALLSIDELTELVVDTWLARAPKRAASQWLADQGLAHDHE